MQLSPTLSLGLYLLIDLLVSNLVAAILSVSQLAFTVSSSSFSPWQPPTSANINLGQFHRASKTFQFDIVAGLFESDLQKKAIFSGLGRVTVFASLISLS